MKATKFIAAAAVFVAAGSAFAADATPAASTAATSAAAVVVASSDKLNVPSIQINKSLSRDRAEVKAEAVEFAKNYRTAFAVQLEQYKN